MEDWFDLVDAGQAYIFQDPPSSYNQDVSDKASYIEGMRRRMKAAAVAVVDFMEGSKSTPALNVIRYQIIKSATSAAANYRAACVARSGKEFFAKMSIVVEEADETVFWLEVLYASRIKVDKDVVISLGKEWRELTKMVSAARSSYRKNRS